MIAATVTTMLHSHESDLYGYVVLLDGGAMLELVGRRDPDTVYARSFRTGQWYLVQRTGWTVRQDMIRVRVTPAVDPGFADDTLHFDPKQGFGGRVNRAVFAR